MGHFECGTAILPLATGCDSVTYLSRSVPTPQAAYRAYGDSITYGVLLTDRTLQAYPMLAAAFEHVTYADNAIPGAQACDLAPTQMFPNLDSPTLATHPTYTVLVGTNDVGMKAKIPAYHAVFMQCHLAALSWIAVPAEHKSLADGKSVSVSGPGMLDTTDHWNSWTTQGPSASVSFTIVLPEAGAIYAWPRIDDESTATYTYALDGVLAGSATVQTNPPIATRNRGTNSMTVIRFPNVAAGRHVVTFTQTSSGTEGVSVVGIGTSAGSADVSMPTVLAGIITFDRDPQDGGPCGDTDPVCDAYIQDIESNVALLVSDGLNVRTFDTRKYMFGSPSEMNDKLHPNVLGHQELAKSVEAVW